MAESDLPAEPISPRERQRSVDRLCAHFAADHLRTAELERRLDLAYAARTRAELVALENDLPALGEAGAAEPVPEPAYKPLVDERQPLKQSDFMISIMGGSERKGRWTPPRRLSVFTLMGGAFLDFREATFATREIEVRVLSVMGGAEIIVPPGVSVEWNGMAIMGGIGGAEPGRPADPAAPRIRINGFVLMGGVDIVERLPGESAREARKRLKAERRARKRLARGS